jgi:hypothetical protein
MSAIRRAFCSAARLPGLVGQDAADQVGRGGVLQTRSTRNGSRRMGTGSDRALQPAHEQCNRVIESRNLVPEPTDTWRQEVLTLKNKLTAEEAKSCDCRRRWRIEALQVCLNSDSDNSKRWFRSGRTANAELPPGFSAESQLGTRRRPNGVLRSCSALVGQFWQTNTCRTAALACGIPPASGTVVASGPALFGHLVFGPRQAVLVRPSCIRGRNYNQRHHPDLCRPKRPPRVPSRFGCEGGLAPAYGERTTGGRCATGRP